MADKPKARFWTIGGDEFGVDERELDQSAQDAAAIVRRLGGAVTMGAIRVQATEDEYVTVGVVFRYDSYVPAAQPIEPAPGLDDGVAPVEEPVEEPVAS